VSAFFTLAFLYRSDVVIDRQSLISSKEGGIARKIAMNQKN